MSDETLLKPREYKRDALGMFERPGATLKNTQKDKLKNKPENIKQGELVTNKSGRGGLRKGAGRPKGVPNKITTALKDAILQAGENAGGKGGLVSYLERLAIENSSAFAGLLGKVLPSTLAADPDSHGGMELTFRRIIVYPDGHQHIEGKTPKQLPPPSSHSLPSDDQTPVESIYSDDKSGT